MESSVNFVQVWNIACFSVISLKINKLSFTQRRFGVLQQNGMAQSSFLNKQANQKEKNQNEFDERKICQKPEEPRNW